MPLFSAIICAVMAAVAAGLAVGYIYERKLHEDAHSANQELSDRYSEVYSENTNLREELSRLNGIAQGRECDTMQRQFLESLNRNGQATVQMPRRQREA